MNIATNLQSLLDARRWTPERLAVESQALGGGECLSVSAIKTWLSGARIPGGQNVVLMARALGTTTDAILCGQVPTGKAV